MVREMNNFQTLFNEDANKTVEQVAQKINETNLNFLCHLATIAMVKEETNL